MIARMTSSNATLLKISGGVQDKDHQISTGVTKSKILFFSPISKRSYDFRSAAQLIFASFIYTLLFRDRCSAVRRARLREAINTHVSTRSTFLCLSLTGRQCLIRFPLIPTIHREFWVPGDFIPDALNPHVVRIKAPLPPPTPAFNRALWLIYPDWFEDHYD